MTAIDPIYLAAQAAQPATMTTKLGENQADFSDWLTKQIGSVNQLIVEGDTQVRKLAVGDTANLHQVMISLEKAKLSFELAVQVRNKLLEAYQEILRMQI